MTVERDNEFWSARIAMLAELAHADALAIVLRPREGSFVTYVAHNVAPQSAWSGADQSALLVAALGGASADGAVNVPLLDGQVALAMRALPVEWRQHRIGALVIRGAGGRLAGILSERDIVRALAEQGAGALDLPVGQAMTRDVETCTEEDSCASIMERMTAGRFRHVPVLRGGKLTGLISIGDVVKHRVDEIERESEAMRDYIQTA